jgi:hypothetical protein
LIQDQGQTRNLDSKIYLPIPLFQIRIPQLLCGDFFNSIDPTETWVAPDFRSAKALFVASLKRGIVASIA